MHELKLACHCNCYCTDDEPVHADGDEIEDWGGGADDVHGDVDVAEEERQGPHVVDLRNEEERRLQI